jgi:hypothetical protein
MLTTRWLIILNLALAFVVASIIAVMQYRQSSISATTPLIPSAQVLPPCELEFGPHGEMDCKFDAGPSDGYLPGWEKSQARKPLK